MRLQLAFLTSVVGLGGMALSFEALANGRVSASAESCDREVRLDIRFSVPPTEVGSSMQVYRSPDLLLQMSAADLPGDAVEAATIDLYAIQQDDQGQYHTTVEESFDADGTWLYFSAIDGVMTADSFWEAAIVDGEHRPCATGETCGSSVCRRDEYCCNGSCGFCTDMVEPCHAIGCASADEAEPPATSDERGCAFRSPGRTGSPAWFGVAGAVALVVLRRRRPH